MDEAESLCDKIAIMINGKFVCYGSPGHLKQKYGQGYEIIARPLNAESSDLVDRHILGYLSFCKKELSINNQQNNQHQAEIIYKIEGNQQDVAADPSRRLSHIFHVMNDMVAQGIIIDFQVTRSSLEHVFIHFAKF